MDKLPPEIEAAFRAFLAANPAVEFSEKSPPPWVRFPDIPRFSIGWRMGAGEDYFVGFARWFQQLNAAKRDAYVLANPEPESWTGFYQGLT